MLQYLLNTTAIWLTCLIAFDLFLRKESYHSYNRLYLLLTFALGILLPLWQWRQDSVAYSTSFSRPVIEQAASIKGNILPDTTITNTYSWQEWLWVIYLVGVGISLLMLIKEAFVINRMYQRGDKSKDGVWSIVETGQSHSPFSAFRMVFISNKKDYSEEQLKMILHHEEQHGHAMHFIDLVLMQLAKTTFWFHPLAYVYYSRLMIVHEYQADAAVDQDPKSYGQFLIEQTMLGTAPTLSHSFNRSPIKKRILMLTRNSSALSKIKMLLVFPVAVLCVLCFSKNAFSDDKRVKNGNVVTYKGNKFEMSEEIIDTTIVVDPATGEEAMLKSIKSAVPLTMNGEPIYNSFANTAGLNTIGVLTSNSLRQYIFDNLKQEFKKLEDGEYFLEIENIVVNKEGRVVYYEFNGLRYQRYANPNNKNKEIDSKIQDVFIQKVTSLMKNIPTTAPAKLNNTAVPFRIDPGNIYNTFKIKNGQIQ